MAGALFDWNNARQKNIEKAERKCERRINWRLMKKKFSKIVGVGLAIALVLSLVLVATPALAQVPASLEKTITLDKDGGEASKTNPMSGLLMVHFMDVGQGDAILIDYGTYEMLIDGGRWSDCAVCMPSYVDGSLEVMVATHPDADHIGGLGNVLDTFDVEHIWLNGDTASTQTYIDFMAKVGAESAQVHQAQRGDQISLSTLTFDVLHPTLPLDSDRNENSIVLRLSFGLVDFLFTGDIEIGGEASMVAAGLIDDIDVLKVSHHGSKYCSTANFLAAARPEIAIYFAGVGNPYGHPAPETIIRLYDIGATIYGTDIHGTIIVMTDGTTYSVHPTNDVPPVVPAGDPWDYDVDEDGEISKTEALAAVVDYFANLISKAQALEVIALYFG